MTGCLQHYEEGERHREENIWCKQGDTECSKGNQLPPATCRTQKEENNQIRAARKKKSEQIKDAFERKEVQVD
ncbi:hypothetical protein EYF80_020010 [Liparis tanakae]|uniref:Uncharacterized protein n=1 Tax=Liparis tanakae TaxID=230148 RepID=A0A4Z2HVS7_9TELE|nr:hypothetical protein EYF80_020010 [Liparis tanakae]